MSLTAPINTTNKLAGFTQVRSYVSPNDAEANPEYDNSGLSPSMILKLQKEESKGLEGIVDMTDNAWHFVPSIHKIVMRKNIIEGRHAAKEGILNYKTEAKMRELQQFIADQRVVSFDDIVLDNYLRLLPDKLFGSQYKALTKYTNHITNEVNTCLLRYLPGKLTKLYRAGYLPRMEGLLLSYTTKTNSKRINFWVEPDLPASLTPDECRQHLNEYHRADRLRYVVIKAATMQSTIQYREIKLAKQLTDLSGCTFGHLANEHPVWFRYIVEAISAGETIDLNNNQELQSNENV